MLSVDVKHMSSSHILCSDVLHDSHTSQIQYSTVENFNSSVGSRIIVICIWNLIQAFMWSDHFKNIQNLRLAFKEIFLFKLFQIFNEICKINMLNIFLHCQNAKRIFILTTYSFFLSFRISNREKISSQNKMHFSFRELIYIDQCQHLYSC